MLMLLLNKDYLLRVPEENLGYLVFQELMETQEILEILAKQGRKVKKDQRAIL